MTNAAPEPPATEGDDGRIGSRIPTAAAGFFVLVAGALSYPFAAVPLGPHGIDAGWQWVVNQAASQSWVFGRDLVFTYGPLGWLVTPQDVNHHLLAANLFRLLALAALIASVVCQLTVTRRSAAAVGFALLWAAASVLGLGFECYVFVIVGALLLHTIRLGAIWPAVFAGAISGFSAFAKTSLLLTTGATILIASVLICRRSNIRTAIAAPGTMLVVGMTSAFVFFPTVSDFLTWLLMSREIVRGYAEAASIIGSPAPLFFCASVLITCAVAGLSAARKTPDYTSILLVLSPAVAVTFRLAFVRQDGHQTLFIPCVVAVLAVAVLGAKDWRVVTGTGAAALVVMIGGSASGALNCRPSELPGRLVAGHPGPRNFARLVNLDQTRLELADRSAVNLDSLKLTERWHDDLAGSPNGVSVIPWELAYAPANGFDLHPLRCTQLYAGHTKKLDTWTSEGLSGPAAPGLVVDDFAPVGKRRALLDTPLTWRTLFLNYDLADFDRERYVLLLRRRPQVKPHRWHQAGATSFEIDGPGAAVPTRPSLVFAEVHAHLNLFGRLNRSFFRVPILLAVFHRADGSMTPTRLIAATSGNGILVNGYPNDISDYVNLWIGRRPVAVTRLQVVGPGKRHYKPQLDIHWKELELLGPEVSDSGR